MNSKIKLPDSFEELKNLSDKYLAGLWSRYFTVDIHQHRKSMYRPLWHKISCEVEGLRVKQKHITRLNKYATDPEKYIERSQKIKYNIKEGVELNKVYRSRTHKVKVLSHNKFLYDGEIYKSISSVAKKICGIKVSGYNFFGLDNKDPNMNINRGNDE